MGTWLLAACGPRVPEIEDPPDWMLGVFSLDPGSDTGVANFHVHADGSLDVYVSDGSGQPPMYQSTRLWHMEDDETLVHTPLLPQEEHWAREYRVTQGPSCGPHPRFRRFGSDREIRSGEWVRGARCLYFGPPPEVEEGCDPCEREWWIDWCDEPPPPCDEGDTDSGDATLTE
jgi:hypothetical protein